jgi:hypothetical protein
MRSPERIIQMVKEAGLDPNTLTLQFELHRAYHRVYPSGDERVHYWLRIWADGQIVREYGRDIGEYYYSPSHVHVSGPWNKPIIEHLAEMERQAEIILTERRRRG